MLFVFRLPAILGYMLLMASICQVQTTTYTHEGNPHGVYFTGQPSRLDPAGLFRRLVLKMRMPKVGIPERLPYFSLCQNMSFKEPCTNIHRQNLMEHRMFHKHKAHYRHYLMPRCAMFSKYVNHAVDRVNQMRMRILMDRLEIWASVANRQIQRILPGRTRAGGCKGRLFNFVGCVISWVFGFAHKDDLQYMVDTAETAVHNQRKGTRVLQAHQDTLTVITTEHTNQLQKAYDALNVLTSRISNLEARVEAKLQDLAEVTHYGLMVDTYILDIMRIMFLTKKADKDFTKGHEHLKHWSEALYLLTSNKLSP